ncbi:MAG: hypothetical protein KGJ55_00425 [Gammaproteobacteria bacterium]|nr:hypothetical protein [Gammaproteobacteria bacterium]
MTAAFGGVPLLGTARVDGATLGFVALAVFTGAFSGCGAVVFRLLIGLFHNFAFFGRLDWHYDANRHTAAASWGRGICLGASGSFWFRWPAP